MPTYFDDEIKLCNCCHRSIEDLLSGPYQYHVWAQRAILALFFSQNKVTVIIVTIEVGQREQQITLKASYVHFITYNIEDIGPTL
jgi:hypothetical protein